MEVEQNLSTLVFPPLLPNDVQLLVPTAYSKLNLLNYCQQLKYFLIAEVQPNPCLHTETLHTKVEIVRRVISNIVDADAVVTSACPRTE